MEAQNQNGSDLRTLETLSIFTDTTLLCPKASLRLANFVGEICPALMDDDSLNYIPVGPNILSPDYLIYSSNCSRYTETVLLKRIGSDYSFICTTAGEILRFDYNDNELTLYVRKQACCCDYFNEYDIIQVDREDLVSTTQFIFHQNTKVSSIQPLKKSFKGMLRTTPEKYYEMKIDTCAGGAIIRGNQWHKVSMNDIVYSLQKQGRWTLVAVKTSSDNWNIGWIK